MSLDLATVLSNAQNPNLEVRQQAEAYLNQATEAQYGQFLLALCIELATEGKADSNRQLAGLYIKNLITAQDEALLQAKIDKWLACDAATKEQIRAGFLEVLKSPVVVVRHTAAQILAAYGAIDVPRKEWANLLPTLFHNISSAEVHEGCKIASLEALGYMCDTMEPENVDEAVVNQILSAIIDGMRADRVDPIKVAAITALNNSLDFTSTNFENQVERDTIMRSICEATQAQDMKIRAKAFECFATVGELYYDKLQSYVTTLYGLSTTAIKSDDATVAMQAIEFWNIICDQEINIQADLEDDPSEELVFHKIMEVACPTLVPLMLENMTKQSEDLDEDDSWNIAMAAATLLEAIAQAVQDKVVDLVVPFVTQNINNANWRLKEAAILSFGMILDGPSAEKLSQLVLQAVPILITCLKDAQPLVRDSSAWTIGRICQLHKTSLSGEILPPMVDGLASALEDPTSKVVSQACFAVHNLAEACEDEADQQTNVLSHFMPLMLQKLLAVTTREDHDQDNIRQSAFEAINRMVENSAKDMLPVVGQLLTEALTRLEASFNPAIQAQEKAELQAVLATLVGELVKKLDAQSIAPMADQVMQLLFQVFNCKGANAHEDALQVMGHVAEKLGSGFARYMPHLVPILMTALQSMEEAPLVTIAVGVVSEIADALKKDILSICDDLMRNLLELLKSSTLDRGVKPHVISVFSDIALAIEGDFERYTGAVLQILKQAGEVNIQADDEELIDYINTLRNSILDAYVGIIVGLSAGKKEDSLLQHLEPIIEFLQRSTSDPRRSEEVLKTAIGFIGDLGKAYGKKMVVVFQQSFVMQLLQQGSSAQYDESIQETAKWAQREVNKAVRG